MSKADELEKLRNLRDDGTITEIEFELEKAKILNAPEQTASQPQQPQTTTTTTTTTVTSTTAAAPGTSPIVSQPRQPIIVTPPPYVPSNNQYYRNTQQSAQTPPYTPPQTPGQPPPYVPPINNNAVNTANNQKSKWVALLLCLFLGVIGAHKFYERKYFIGVVYIFTYGFLGIGVLLDIICILFKPNPYYI